MLGILCGLESEARIAAKINGALVVCAAARPRKARELAHELIAKGATRLLSFGIAGSLDATVALGDVFVATRVVSSAGHWLCDESWGRALADKIPQAKRGSVYGSENLIATIAEKEALNQTTGCAIVDMESQCVAEIADETRTPFIVVRAVCDDCVMNVPPFVMAAVAEDGTVKVTRALGHIMMHPMQIRDLAKVASGTGRALTSLRAIASSI